MKKLLFVIAVTTCCVSYAQSWVQLTDFMGTQRDDGVAFVINNKAYCTTGLDIYGCTNNGFVFDGATETWSAMASLPPGTERQYAAGFSYNNLGYIMGGINCSNVRLNDFWQYSPSTNSWTALPNFPGMGRYGTSNFIIKNKAYIIGGTLANNTLSNQVWEYNFTTAVWTQKNNLPLNAMHRGSAFAIDTLGYACYGIDNNNAFNHYIYTYNYITDSWRRVSNLIMPSRYYIGTAVCSNKAALYGGIDSLTTISNNYTIFNPADSSLTNLLGIPSVARKGGMAFSINNIFYITTGYSTANVRIKETWKNTDLVGINELKINEDEFKIYPNPAQEVINVELLVFNKEPATILITNTLGQVVREEEITFTNNQSAINIQQLKSGIYFIQFIDDKKQLISTHKFIKE